MLIVRGTKKLRDRIKQAPTVTPTDVSTTSLGDWFATALFWKPQVALLVNTKTMIPVLTPLAPAGKLLDRVPDAVADVLREHGVPDDVVDAEVAEMETIRLAPTNDRQLLGVMNEFVFQAEGVWGTNDPDLFSVSMRLADVLLGPLMKHGHGTPADELAAHFATGATVLRFPTTQRSARSPKHATHRGQVHQLKVTLKRTKPPIWRRIVVGGDQTLDHLHEVIQAAFGWWNSHLHEFRIDGIDYGTPHEDDWTPVNDERRVSIDQALADARTIDYVYDFGDDWDHTIIVEHTFQANDPDRPATTPDCIDGQRACPPEDSGGPWGCTELLAILADPRHPEHAERLEWHGGPIDADAFDRADFEENLRLQSLTRLD